VLQVKQEAIIWPHCEGERCAGKHTNEYTTIYPLIADVLMLCHIAMRMRPVAAVTWSCTGDVTVECLM
jgi:hypothetical protein